ncbi:MAG: 3-oxoacyl-ACP reductase FabG [Chitinispirillia bacterium]|nr:3-oxoacyl-ACP reductase FabG [Chitinispirillia bacterium]MCL2267712.1 3-oxoacyl-ACP reductase FabG [Chitinispirillia bacterium]
MGLLDGKKVIVTGGSRGIGLAVVKQCLSEGANVAASYCRGEGGLANIQSDRLKSYRMDVTDVAQLKTVTAAMTGDLGGLDVLVNNAGISEPSMFMMMSDDTWDSVIKTNLYGTYHMIKEIVFPMYGRKSGAIINISSVYGLVGGAGQSAYCASKAALIGLTQALSKELSGRNVRVNAVAPGFIDTDMVSAMSDRAKAAFMEQIPMKRFGTAEEVAEVVVFLASDKAGYITGQTIVIDGGMY